MKKSRLWETWQARVELLAIAGARRGANIGPMRARVTRAILLLGVTHLELGKVFFGGKKELNVHTEPVSI